MRTMRSAPFVARRVTASPNIGSVQFPAQETHLRICDGTGRAHGSRDRRERPRDDVFDQTGLGTRLNTPTRTSRWRTSESRRTQRRKSHAHRGPRHQINQVTPRSAPVAKHRG